MGKSRGRFIIGRIIGKGKKRNKQKSIHQDFVWGRGEKKILQIGSDMGEQ